MYMFELMRRSVFQKFSYDQQRFFAKMIMRDVEKAAVETGRPVESVYYWYSKGLYGGDRKIDMEVPEC